MKEAVEDIKNIPEGIREILHQIHHIGNSLGYEAYIVGGAVRDILLGAGLSDIDITVVGDARRLAGALGKGFGYDFVVHSPFKTVTLNAGCEFRIDIATARRETYSGTAALPEVYPSGLRDDLYRRDFTINSMALSLQDYTLVDPFGGREDLRKGIIRVLHDKSFVDDPTRIMRCIRFERRYGFKTDKRTRELMAASIKEGYPGRLSSERVLSEMEHILREPRFIEILVRMEETGLWKVLFGGSAIPRSTYSTLERIQKDGGSELLFAVLALLEGINHRSLNRVFSGYKTRYRNLEAYRSREKALGLPVGSKPLGNGELYRLFGGVDKEILEYLAAAACTVHYKNNIIKYMRTLRGFRFHISGKDLEAFGVEPGPCYRILLERARFQIVEGAVTDRQQQIEVLKSIIEKGE